MRLTLPALFILAYPLGAIAAEFVSGAAQVRIEQLALVAATLAWLILQPKLDQLSNNSRTSACAGLIAIALLARLLLLPLAPSDDLHRYLWEGRVIAAGFDPYRLPPDAPELESLRDDHWPFINHPDHAAIYPPLIQWLFACVVRISPSAAALKLGLLSADLGAAWLLWRVRRGAGLRYALCPLVLRSFAHEAHLDAVMVFGLALVLSVQKRSPRGARAFLAQSLGLALAAGTKWVGLLAVFSPCERGKRGLLRKLVAAIAHIAFAALAIAVAMSTVSTLDASTLAPLFNFATRFRALDLGQRWIDTALAALPASNAETLRIAFSAVALAGVVLFAYRGKPDAAALQRRLFGGLLLILPTVHYWYASWLAPGLALGGASSWRWLMLSMTFALEADAIGAATGEWRQPIWVSYAVFLPVALAALVGAARRTVWKSRGLQPARA